MVINCVNEPECASCDKGDIIADGEVNSADGIRGLLIAMELIVPSADEFCAADMNSDGIVDVGDIVLVLQAAVGLAPAASADPARPLVFASPGENPGEVVLRVENAAGVDVVMSYDPRAVSFVSATRPGSSGVLATNAETPGELRLGFAKSAAFHGEILLKFDVVEPHTSLVFEKVHAYDDGGFGQNLEIPNPEIYFGATSTEPSRVWTRSALLNAAPNPFNPTTQLRFVMAEPGDAQLEIFDAAGRTVRQFQMSGLAAGQHEVMWNGRDDRGARVASGAYVVRLETSHGETDTDRVVMLK
jgi:hypothetical protein